MEELDELLTPEEVAKRLKVAKVTPYQWAQRGVLPYYKLEGVVRFRLQDIKDFVRSGRIEKKVRTRDCSSHVGKSWTSGH